jgi:hypothetical protein
MVRRRSQKGKQVIDSRGGALEPSRLRIKGEWASLSRRSPWKHSLP